MRLTNLAVLVTLSLIWGSAFALVKVVLEDVPPMTLVAGRMTFAASFLTLALIATGRATLLGERRSWFAFVALGLGNNVWPFVLLTLGQQHVESSLAAILVAGMPLTTSLLAHFWIRERLTPDRALGVLVGFAGVFLLIGGDLRDVTESSGLAQLAIVAGMVGYSFGTVFARRYLGDSDAGVWAAGQTLVGAAVMIPVALAVDQPFDLSISAKTAIAWVSLGVVASGVAYLLFFPLIRRVTATQASMVGYLIPVWALLIGVLILDEHLESTAFAGLGLIIAGVWIVNGGGHWLAERVFGHGRGADAPRVASGSTDDDVSTGPAPS
ncbi:MAG: DMT family transporter [Dehalococcoidia bacterium]